jgi:hypothetical protein
VIAANPAEDGLTVVAVPSVNDTWKVNKQPQCRRCKQDGHKNARSRQCKYNMHKVNDEQTQSEFANSKSLVVVDRMTRRTYV